MASSHLLLSSQSTSSETKSVETVPNSEKISFLTYNNAMFPTVCGRQIANGDVLPANSVRQEIIAAEVLRRNYGVIGFQEVWSNDTANYYDNEFRTQYPHRLRGTGGYNCCGSWVSGGLLLYSKYKIVESHQMTFTHTLGTVEKFGQKGAIFAKIEIAPNKLLAVTVLHLNGGAGACCSESHKSCYGTTSACRGQQLEEILNASRTFIRNDVIAHIVMGDFNFSLTTTTEICETKGEEPTIIVDDRRPLGVSTGDANNEMKKYDVKYPGQTAFFQAFQARRPINHTDPRHDLAARGEKVKHRCPDRLSAAEKAGHFTGTDRGNLQNISPQGPTKLLDGIFRRRGATVGRLETSIISLDGVEEGKAIPTSDHFAIQGELDLTKPPERIVGVYDDSKPEPFESTDPAAGCCNGWCCHPGCKKPVITRHRLYPSHSVTIAPTTPQQNQQKEDVSPLTKALNLM